MEQDKPFCYYGYLMHSARVATLFYVSSKVQECKSYNDELGAQLWDIHRKQVAASLIEGNY